MRAAERWAYEYGWLEPWEYEPVNMPTPDEFEDQEEEETDDEWNDRYNWHTTYMKYGRPLWLNVTADTKADIEENFINICQRFAGLTKDKSVPEHIKKDMQVSIKKELEHLMIIFKNNYNRKGALT